MSNEKIALYPGSFDPPTNGHIDVIKRALTIFDRVVVAVISNPSKKTLFTISEREKMLKEIYNSAQRVEVISFSGLLVDLAEKTKCQRNIKRIESCF